MIGPAAGAPVPSLEEVLAERYPLAWELERELHGPGGNGAGRELGRVLAERYGSPPTRPRGPRAAAATSAAGAGAKQSAGARRRREYRVTSDARVSCACGVWVYTEAIDGAPPALPAACWRCGAELPPDREPADADAGAPAKGSGR